MINYELSIYSFPNVRKIKQMNYLGLAADSLVDAIAQKLPQTTWHENFIKKCEKNYPSTSTIKMIIAGEKRTQKFESSALCGATLLRQRSN